MIKGRIALFVEKLKKLNGDPHYVALGMAIGVFVAITPTIPFHTILAIVLALIFKASKPAAVLGVWVSNPFTVVFLYIACYKVGHLFFDTPGNAVRSIQLLIEHLETDAEFSHKLDYLAQFMKNKMKIFMVMNLGGLILGLPSGVAAYIVTRQFITRIRKIRKKQ